MESMKCDLIESVESPRVACKIDYYLDLHESEASIGKALKGDVVVYYYDPLITQLMGASGSSSG